MSETPSNHGAPTDGAPTPFAPQVITLSNGMTLINVYDPNSTAVHVQITMRSGSRDETRATAGLKHFEEHEMFDGTPSRPTEDIIGHDLEITGGAANAFTGQEMVSYFGDAPVDQLLPLADVLTDMLSGPLFEPKKMDRERIAVLEEEGNYQQNRGRWVGTALLGVAFAGTSLAWSPGGFEDVITSVTHDEMVAFHRQAYDPHAMALLVSGGAYLDRETAERLVSRFPSGHVPERTPPIWGQGEKFVGKTVAVGDGERQQVNVGIGIPGIAHNDPDALAVEVLESVAGGGQSSRLALLLRHNPSLAAGMAMGNAAFTDTGMFEFNLATSPGNEERAVSALVGELHRLAEHPVGPAELARAKTGISAGLLQETEGADALGQYYSQRWAVGQPLVSPLQLADQIDAVDAASVQRVAKRLMAGLGQARLAFIHPADPKTGLNDAGDTLQQEGARLLAAVTQTRSPSVPAAREMG